MATTTIKKTTKKVIAKKAVSKTTVQKVKTFVHLPVPLARQTGKKQTKTDIMKKTPVIQKNDFAIIETGGKQYKVYSGDTIKIEKLPGTYKEGAKIIFDKVLLVSNDKTVKIGTPYVSGAKIEAVFKEEGRSKKITVIKFKSKSRYLRKGGHRQSYVKVSIK